MSGTTAHDATERLVRLQAVTAALSEAPTAAAIADVLATHLTGLVGADSSGIFRLDPETRTLELVTAAGVTDPAALEPHVRVGLDAALPVSEAVRERRAVWLVEPADWRPYVDAMRPTTPPVGAVGALPVVADGAPVGSLYVFYGEGRGPGPDERRLVSTIARQAAHALRRAELLEAAERDRERAARLQRVTGALARAATPDEVARAIVRDAREALGADGALVYALSRDGDLELLGQDGFPGGQQAAWARIALDVDAPVPEAVRGNAPVVLESPEAVRAAYPALDLSDVPAGAVAAVPLPLGDGPCGAILFAFDERRRLPGDERGLVMAIARICAQALERARLHVATRAARDRADRLQATTAALASTLTREDVARVVTTDGVAALGAVIGGLMALTAEGDELELLGMAGYAPPATRRFARVPLDGPYLFAEAVRTGRAHVVADLDAVAGRFPHLREITGGRSTAGAIVPLVVGSRTTGALAFGFADDRDLDDERLTLLRTLGQLAAQALDRAHLYEARHEVASRLQTSLLPDALPELDDAQVAARYLAGTAGLEVGGDWYDVIELGDGRLGLAAGDVVGRGLQAAATMGRLRSALAALAPECRGPADLLERLDAFAGRGEGLPMATVVYALVDPSAAMVEYACAGHPPPLLVDPDGAASVLPGGRSAPLGAPLGPRRTQARARLEPGSSLLLYTDGLVERRGEPLDHGFERLAAAAAAHAGCEPDELCARVLDDLVGADERRDDVALLCARTTRSTTAALLHRMPPDPRELAGLRGALRTWLRTAEAPADRARDLVLAVSEAALNAVEHAGATQVTVRLRRVRDGTLVASVHDDGRWRRPVAEPLRGRGLALARALVDDVDVRPEPDGTTVVLRASPGG
jgi:GAF domain-containing protein/anti-sigma regulatory factor (Ser/Thr protein kinase)